jgi:DNA mismatch endonuclease (patch repair protein)
MPSRLHGTETPGAPSTVPSPAMAAGGARGDPPLPPSPLTRRRLSTQRTRDTAPELHLRRELHRRGRRFYVDRAPLTGLRRRADLVFPRRKVAVYVDGCFWHCCPDHATHPKHNAAWWAAKLTTNVARDRDTDARLTAAGWVVVRVWEHQAPTEGADLVERALSTG